MAISIRNVSDCSRGTVVLRYHWALRRIPHFPQPRNVAWSSAGSHLRSPKSFEDGIFAQFPLVPLSEFLVLYNFGKTVSNRMEPSPTRTICVCLSACLAWNPGVDQFTFKWKKSMDVSLRSAIESISFHWTSSVADRVLWTNLIVFCQRSVKRNRKSHSL